jgi:hypothetical protein
MAVDIKFDLPMKTGQRQLRRYYPLWTPGADGIMDGKATFALWET